MWYLPSYGATIINPLPPDQSDPLSPEGNNFLQEIINTFLFIALALDNMMLVTLNDLAPSQTKGTEQTATATVRFLNYCTTHP